MRILIANRGEIARRIIRTAHRLGHETLAVFADPDADAPFVTEATEAMRLGPTDLAASYLSIDALIAAARVGGATAVHPGYGFLSEHAGFARAVITAGLVWIGPRAEAIEGMGSKIEARRVAEAARVPTIPGYDASQDSAEQAAAADRIGYPVLVKAAAGGGGKGIRIAPGPGDFAAARAEAAAEAERAFGDGAVIVERFIGRPRHVEVQVVGDQAGTVIHLGTRECSVQRRYQKVLEEAPAPNLAEWTRSGLHTAAVRLAGAIGYDSAGTVEFIVDDATGEFFFLEMNTRLQVEHPVTEEVTGLDLVELQIRSALGEPLPVGQDGVTFRGHAFEARINAEDAAAGFAPQTGVVTHLRVPEGIRWESGVVLGSTVTPHYDSMVAKLIAYGPDRDAARRRLADALDQLLIGGLVTTAGFQRWLVDQPPVAAGRVTTRYLDETELPDAPDAGAAAVAAAGAWATARDATRRPDPWRGLSRLRVTPHESPRVLFLEDGRGVVYEAEVPSGATEAAGPASVDLTARSVAVSRGGHTHTFRVVPRSEHWAPSAMAGHGSADAVVAPFPAVVTEVKARPGEEVAAGQILLVIEAMKMLHSLTAAGHGEVAEVRVAAGDQVASGQVLITFVPARHGMGGDGEG